MVKGLLIQAKGSLGVVMTQEGRFVRVLLTGGQRALGQEVSGRELHFPFLVQGLAVASLLLVLMVGVWAKMIAVPAASAYVALDINPSVELAVNQVGQVIQCKGLDADGQKLIKDVVLDKMEVYQALDLLVQGAAKQHYLNETNNVVLATVTKVDKASVVDETKIKDSVSNAVTSLTIPVKIIIEQATPQERKQASAKGVSVGRYLIYQESSKQGAHLTIEDIKNKGLGQLEKEKGWHIEQVLPHAKYSIPEQHQQNIKGSHMQVNHGNNPSQVLNYWPQIEIKKEDLKEKVNEKGNELKNQQIREHVQSIINPKIKEHQAQMQDILHQDKHGSDDDKDKKHPEFNRNQKNHD